MITAFDLTTWAFMITWFMSGVLEHVKVKRAHVTIGKEEV